MRCCTHRVEQWQPPQQPAWSAWRTRLTRRHRPDWPCRRAPSGSAQADAPDNRHTGAGGLGSGVPACISTWRRLSGAWGIICTGVIIRVVFRLTICYSRGGRLSAADSTGQRRQPAYCVEKLLAKTCHNAINVQENCTQWRCSARLAHH